MISVSGYIGQYPGLFTRRYSRPDADKAPTILQGDKGPALLVGHREVADFPEDVSRVLQGEVIQGRQSGDGLIDGVVIDHAFPIFEVLTNPKRMLWTY